MYSEDSSDDEFFDPEEEVAPPSPSWLTRQQSVGVGSTEDRGAGEIPVSYTHLTLPTILLV